MSEPTRQCTDYHSIVVVLSHLFYPAVNWAAFPLMTLVQNVHKYGDETALIKMLCHILYSTKAMLLHTDYMPPSDRQWHTSFRLRIAIKVDIECMKGCSCLRAWYLSFPNISNNTWYGNQKLHISELHIWTEGEQHWSCNSVQVINVPHQIYGVQEVHAVYLMTEPCTSCRVLLWLLGTFIILCICKFYENNEIIVR